MNAGEITINASESIPKDEKIREVCQLDIVTDEVNSTNVTHVSNTEHRDAIKGLVDEYKPQKTQEIKLKMTILLKDDDPVCQRARRLSPIKREQVNIQIDEWIREGIVEPSLSEYASPVVLARKKNGSIRLCVDYQQLNKKIIKDRYPLPLVEDQLDLLQSARYFSTLDLKNGFLHVYMDEQSRKLTAFIVRDGHDEFLRVPFGLCNSPAVFQRFINAVFRDLIQEKMVLAYMDDLIIPSFDYETGIRNLRAILRTVTEAGLEINWLKCQFLQ
ncbi:hypothetical protein HN011_004966 [Eciton burchellii]|nr:hypothetical protein HN011_004966 [Eciton burchellii]